MLQLEKEQVKLVRIDSSDEIDESDSGELNEGNNEEDFDAMVNGDEQNDLLSSSSKNIATDKEAKSSMFFL